MPEVVVSQLRFAGSGTALRHSLACEENKKNTPKSEEISCVTPLCEDNILQNN